jgi:hypothetical protein
VSNASDHQEESGWEDWRCAASDRLVELGLDKLVAFMVAHELRDEEHSKLVIELKEAGCDPIAMVMGAPKAAPPTVERLIDMIERDLPPLPYERPTGSFDRGSFPLAPAWATRPDRMIHGTAEFEAMFGCTTQLHAGLLRIFPEEPRGPWWERGIKLGGDGRCWLWLNVHGAGVRLWRIELNIYVHGKDAGA